MLIIKTPLHNSFYSFNSLIASDSSGRYRGQFFFGNDFWTGSLQFCKEVNNEMHAIRKEASKNLTRSIKHVEMGFFVARLMVKLTPGLRKV